ncbi:hypothetical protein MYU51_012743 [Penicillium brevicompactum]|uniref:uncharacterized protein n=1 Tax=Penicillium brevicompactum TaxID=5074 RepID=UPI0025422CF1|nr:uncharacterized protein N7506_011544 [Penicillium brevicompactum]KAJ5318840.1 hypothetical protein N7506_011544 [Penicillium brevicompactum]
MKHNGLGRTRSAENQASQVSDDVRRTVGPYGSHNRLNRKHTKGLSTLNELILAKKHTLFRANITPRFFHTRWNGWLGRLAISGAPEPILNTIRDDRD